VDCQREHAERVVAQTKDNPAEIGGLTTLVGVVRDRDRGCIVVAEWCGSAAGGNSFWMVGAEGRFDVIVLWPASQPSSGGLMTVTQGRGDALVL
jgi:hypothetical protein